LRASSNGLLSAIAAFERENAAQLDPVIAAAILAFGVVRVRPFSGDCSALTRYLVQHALSRSRLHGDEFPVALPMKNRAEE
jgi:hypothetical protein